MFKINIIFFILFNVLFFLVFTLIFEHQVKNIFLLLNIFLILLFINLIFIFIYNKLKTLYCTIKEENAVLKTLLYAFPDYIFLKTKEGKILQQNEITNVAIYQEIINQAAINEVMQSLEPQIKKQWITSGYRKILLDEYIFPYYSDSNEFIGVLYIGRDITETAVVKNDLNILQKLSQVGVWKWNLKTNQMFFSTKVHRLFNVSEDIYTDYQFFLYSVYKEDIALVKAYFSNLLQEHEKFSYLDHRIILDNGEVRWLCHNTELIFSENKEPIEIVGVMQDITQRKQIEEKLKTLSFIVEQADAAIILTDKNVCITWVNNAFTMLSGYSLAEIKGKQPQEFLHGKETSQATEKMIMQALINKKPIRVEIVNYNKNNKFYWIYLLIKPIFDDMGNNIGFFSIATNITDKKQKEAEIYQLNSELQNKINQLHESEIKFQLMTESLQEVVWMSDANLETILYISPFYKTLLNYSNPQDFFKAIHHQEREYIVDYIKENSDSHWDVSYRIFDAYHNLLWIRNKGKAVKDIKGNIKFLIGSAIDITEFKKNEIRIQALAETLQELNNKITGIIESTTDLVVAIDVDFNLMGFNNAYKKHYYDFWDIKVAIGDNLKKVYENIYEKDEIMSIWQKALAGTPYKSLRHTTDKKGKIHFYETVCNPIFNENKQIIGATKVIREVTEIIQTKKALLQKENFLQTFLDTSATIIFSKDLQGRYQNMNKIAEEYMDYSIKEILGKTDDELFNEEIATNFKQTDLQVIQTQKSVQKESYLIKNEQKKYFLIVKFPLLDENNNIYGIGGIATDITEKTEQNLQLKAYAEELKRSNSELEEFAYIASHDLQEPLRKIQAFGDRLFSYYQEVLDEKGQDYLNRMQSAAKRMQTLIQDLLDYSRVASRAKPFKLIDMNKLIQEVISTMEVNIEKQRAEIIVLPLKNIHADNSQIYQLMQNLISNALKFKKTDINPIIKVYNPDIGEIPINDINIEEYSFFAIKDNGIGFDVKYLSRIFMPFQRLHGKDVYEGTGIGLATCRKIVERHKGKITAISQINQGTTFYIALPK